MTAKLRPLKGLRVIEMGGLAPINLCGMILSDFGADILRVDKVERKGSTEKIETNKFDISKDLTDVEKVKKRHIQLNIKDETDRHTLTKLISKGDVFMESFRPGVMERLKLGPSDLKEVKSDLIYARLTGYGQEMTKGEENGRQRQAGHDINYVAMSGFLSMLTDSKNSPSKPFPPINLLADFAAGSLLTTLGILCAVINKTPSSEIQVVDASMTHGLSYLSTWIFNARNTFLLNQEPGRNVLDGGYHFYNVYQTSDRKWLAVGAIEEKFYMNLLDGLGLERDIKLYPQFCDESKRVELSKLFTSIIRDKSERYWTNEVFNSEKLDACVTPVKSWPSFQQPKPVPSIRNVISEVNEKKACRDTVDDPFESWFNDAKLRKSEIDSFS